MGGRQRDASPRRTRPHCRRWHANDGARHRGRRLAPPRHRGAGRRVDNTTVGVRCRRHGIARHLFDARPELNKHELAPMEPFSYKARDGLEVHGYITFPTGVERKALPAVVNVHGGPWARDMWGYHPEAQWLSNRGYVCIQVNYRGSTGYGKDFLNAGDREWGGKMHDDLLDALDYVVEQGWVDRKKVAIYGGSYGGSAAVVGGPLPPPPVSLAGGNTRPPHPRPPHLPLPPLRGAPHHPLLHPAVAPP